MALPCGRGRVLPMDRRSRTRRLYEEHGLEEPLRGKRPARARHERPDAVRELITDAQARILGVSAPIGKECPCYR